MRHRSVERRPTRHPLTLFTCGFSALALCVACSDDTDGGGGEAVASTTVPFTGETTTTLRLDTPTSIIANCAQMPAASAISAIVGIPLADGQVTGAGTCHFTGLNDQSRVVTLALLIDPVDQANFNDLEVSLGPSAPVDDPTLPNAMIDPTSLVYINFNGAIYTVRTLVTDATPAEQVSLSVAILHLWLQV